MHDICCGAILIQWQFPYLTPNILHTQKPSKKRPEKKTVNIKPDGKKLNHGRYGLNRTGHGGSSREANYESARNYFIQFLKSPYLKLMSENDESDFEGWVANTADAESIVCDSEYCL